MGLFENWRSRGGPNKAFLVTDDLLCFTLLIVLLICLLFLFHVNPCGLCGAGNLTVSFYLYLLCSVLSFPVVLWCAFVLIAGKREAPPFSQPAAVAKKPKTEERAAVKLSAIASLAAYGEGDSSDEEGSISPEDNKQDVPQKTDNRESRHGATRLPFWAVRQ